MTQYVIHRPRVAWDGARAFMAVIEAGGYQWLARTLGERVGREAQDHVLACVVRFGARPESQLAETGMWRVYLDDLLGSRPDLARPLLDIIDEARARTNR